MRRDSSERDRDETDTRGKPSWFGELWRGTKSAAAAPFQAFPKEEIVEGARFIGCLVTRRGEGSRARQRKFPLDADGSFDVRALAFLEGMSVLQLESALARRQKSTARAAYVAFGLGWLCFLGWVGRAYAVHWSATSLVQALEFLPFLVFFFAAAFRSALANFQLRTRRLASAKDYLLTREPFWPR
jgi:hypothetical protein